MNHWEFLIQHEDNQSWHPILNSVWTITEGKYHLIAQTDCPEMDVEIHLSSAQLGFDDMAETVQKISSCTNSQGQLTIFPLTELVAGTLDIHCHSDLMSEMLGNSWHKKLKLEVLSKETETIMPTPNGLDASDMLIDIANGIEADLDLDELLHDLEISLPKAESDSTHLLSQEEKIAEIETVSTQSNSSEKPIQLILEQDSLVREAEQPITFSGTVQLNPDHEQQTGCHEYQFHGLLRLELREPSTSAVLFIWESPLLEHSLPFHFSETLNVPASCEIPLVAGEIVLEDNSGDYRYSQTLSIVTDLATPKEEEKHINYTIELSSLEGADSFSFDLMIPEDVIATSLPLNLVQPRKPIEQPMVASPGSNKVLPPKLSRHRTPVKPGPKLPKLPKNKVQA